MRSICLIATGALVLGGCGRNAGEANSANQAEVVSASNIVSNDVTAIDAVTADAANMAADVPLDENLGNDLDNMLNDSGNVAASAKPKASKPAATNTSASDTNSAE
jgi:hypothetical protein